MANSYRSIVEVLKFAEPKEVLIAVSETCAVWLKAANSNELWWDFCDLYGVMPCTDQDSGKTAFRVGDFDLKVSELPLVRPDSITRFSIPDLQKTHILLSTPVTVNQFTAYCYLSLKRLLICGGGDPIGNNAYSIDLDSGLVTTLANMKLARRSHAAYKYRSSVYVFGGKQRNFLDSIEKYSISKDSWELLPSHLANPMEAFVPARYRQDIYLVGSVFIEIFNIPSEVCRLFPLSLPQNWYYSLPFITKKGEIVIAQRDAILSCSVLAERPIFTSASIACIGNGSYWTTGTPVVYEEAIYSFQNTHGSIHGILRMDRCSLRKISNVRY